MRIPVLIPFKPGNPKTRLSHVMTRDERELFAEAMLSDVIKAVEQGGFEPILLSTEIFAYNSVQVRVSTDGLNEAIDTAMSGFFGPAAIIMADCALVTPSSVTRLCQTEAMMGIVPGKGGGTNAIFMQAGNRFKAHYYGQSFRKHCAYAEESGISYEVIDSFRLHIDIDEEEDLVEVFLHNSGEAKRLLRYLGFDLMTTNGRVGIQRNQNTNE